MSVSEEHPVRSIARVRFAAPHWLALLGILSAFSTLYTAGTRYGFEKSVEFWLFLPGDSAPIVVILVAAWLAYRRSNRLRVLPLSTGPWSLILTFLFLGLVSFAWAVYTQALDLQVLSLGFVVAGMAVNYLGAPGLRVLWLPLVVLLFAVPLPAPLMLAVVYKLQMWTAALAGASLYALGIPHLVSGDQIIRVTEAFQVIEGCSGMRSIQILTLLTILLVDLFQRRGWHAALLIVSAPLVAFALNGVRVLTLILNPHSEIIAIHNLQGIAILLVGLIVVYAADGFLERFPALSRPAGDFLPAERKFSYPASLVASAATALALLGLNAGLPPWESSESEIASLHTLVGEALDKWSSEKLDPDFSFRGSARFGEVVKRKYRLDTGPVSVFMAESDFDQRGGSPLSPVTAVPGSGWKLTEDEDLPDSRWGGVQERVAEKGKRRELVRHWVVGTRGLLAETLRSFLALDRSPLRRAEPIVVVRLSTPIADRRANARGQAERRLDLVESRLEDAILTAAGLNGPSPSEG